MKQMAVDCSSAWC